MRIIRWYVNFFVPRNHAASQIKEEYSIWPPPIWTTIITILEFIFYLTDKILEPESVADGPLAEIFIYDPTRRYEIWRYVTYMFVHGCLRHLLTNLLMQAFLGIPLEIVHRRRILIVYISGVVAGSLGTFLFHPTLRLAGSSGGTYALKTAHVSTILMNWSEMTYPVIQCLILLISLGSDVGIAIYNRHFQGIDETSGFTAHVFGGMAGFLVGLIVLRNLENHKHEKLIWWTAVLVFSCLMMTIVLRNVFSDVPYWTDEVFMFSNVTQNKEL